MTPEEHYAEGERRLFAAEAANHPSAQAARAAIAAAHFIAALYRPAMTFETTREGKLRQLAAEDQAAERRLGRA